jgi:hypothetical protein
MPVLKRRCSFCHKTETQVAKLVAGPRIFPWLGPRLFLCDACAAKAFSLMNANPPPGASARN